MYAVNIMGEVKHVWEIEPNETYMLINGATTLMDIAKRFPNFAEMQFICQQYYYMQNAYGIAA